MRYIKVKGTKYTLAREDLSRCEPAIEGYVDLYKKHIGIHNGLSEREATLALMHEIGHIIMHEVSLDRVISPDIEEMIVENFAQEHFRVFFKDGIKGKE